MKPLLKRHPSNPERFDSVAAHDKMVNRQTQDTDEKTPGEQTKVKARLMKFSRLFSSESSEAIIVTQ